MFANVRRSSLFVAATAALCIISTAKAQTAWTPWTTVEMVYAGYADGAVYVRLINSDQNPGACSSTTYRHSDDPATFLSIVLTAFIAGKEVSIRVDNACFSEYRIAEQVRMR